MAAQMPASFDSDVDVLAAQPISHSRSMRARTGPDGRDPS
jgi:hypothetical protein